MEKYLTKKYLAVLVGTLVVSSLFLATSYYKKTGFFFSDTVEKSDTGLITIGNPIRLQIPSIDVDTKIESLGRTKDGAMASPKSRFTVSWYNKGTMPGNEGSAVMAGHTNWKNGQTAIFDSLYKLKIGDKLSVLDDKENTVSFIVTETRIYDKNAVVPEVFFSDVGNHLNLITCFGVWDTITGTSAKRLVVFTDMIS